MIKKIISVFTFGLLLMLLGIVGSLMNWPQANILLGMGVVFELVAVVMFSWEKIKRN